MCDGYKYNQGLALATNSYSIEDNYLLINALNNNFSFSSRLIKDHNYPSIFIPKKDLALLQRIVLPYTHFTMLYKIYL